MNKFALSAFLVASIFSSSFALGEKAEPSNEDLIRIKAERDSRLIEAALDSGVSKLDREFGLGTKPGPAQVPPINGACAINMAMDLKNVYRCGEVNSGRGIRCTGELVEKTRLLNGSEMVKYISGGCGKNPAALDARDKIILTAILGYLGRDIPETLVIQ
jgi:hypothetical protein